MKFKIDENLPLEFAQALQSVGHDAVTVVQEGLSGVPDPEVMFVCHSEHRVIVTLDVDLPISEHIRLKIHQESSSSGSDPRTNDISFPVSAD